MFILSHLSRAQLRLNKSSNVLEHATLAVIALLLVKRGCTTVSIHSKKKAEIEVWTLSCQERFKVWSRRPRCLQDGLLHSKFHTWSLCNHACFRGARKTDAVDW